MDISKYQCVNVKPSYAATNHSRQSLLMWLNELLGSKIRNVESLCTGAVYCQLIDMLFPGSINLKRVKLVASQTTDNWNNFKQLQIALRALKCDKDVPIDILIKGRFQDNFEFLQWFKKFYDLNKSESSASSGNNVSKGQQEITKVESRHLAAIRPKVPSEEAKIKHELNQFQEHLDKVMEEKDFYFQKLRAVEDLCISEEAPNTPKDAFIQKILAVLYETAEGFEVAEEG